MWGSLTATKKRQFLTNTIGTFYKIKNKMLIAAGVVCVYVVADMTATKNAAASCRGGFFQRRL